MSYFRRDLESTGRCGARQDGDGTGLEPGQRAGAVEGGRHRRLAWLAVQAHLSAVLVAAPLFAALVAQPLVKRNSVLAGERAALAVAVVLVLQIPSAISYRPPA